MCAENTTYSFLSTGSEPSRMPTTSGAVVAATVVSRTAISPSHSVVGCATTPGALRICSNCSCASDTCATTALSRTATEKSAGSRSPAISNLRSANLPYCALNALSELTMMTSPRAPARPAIPAIVRARPAAVGCRQSVTKTSTRSLSSVAGRLSSQPRPPIAPRREEPHERLPGEELLLHDGIVEEEGPAVAAGLEPEPPEFARDVARRPGEPGARRIAPAHRVVGDEKDAAAHVRLGDIGRAH